MTVPAQRPLFRQEVIAFQQVHRHWGRVVPLQPVPVRLMVWFVAACAAAVFAFLFLAHYARKETVIGYLSPAAGTARVFAPQQGIVSAVHVELGQQVQAGQPLLSIAMDQVAANGEDVNAAVVATLERQRESLRRQVIAEESRGASEHNRLLAQMRGLEAELADIAAQQVLQRDRIRVVERLVQSGAALAQRGLVSEVDQRRREESLLEQRLSLSSLGQQITVKQNALTAARYTFEQLPTATAEKVQQLRTELAGTEQRIAEVNGRRAYIIRAPIGGQVTSLQASVGQVADPRRMQLQIVPGSSALQAEVFIPARAIGFVEVGQVVRILYDAFPYQHYGTYRGHIVSVSQTLVTGTDVVAPITLAGPAYRAVVALDRPDVDANGRLIPLQPDMLLRADVILERRTLVEWILHPLRSARVQG